MSHSSNSGLFDTSRARAYISRLPVFTRTVAVAIIAISVLALNPFWEVRRWGALVPSKVTVFNAYRISTFPLIHLNIIHAVLNVLALTPLMERFELEHGTLTTLSLFFGPLTSIPAVTYIFLDRTILRGDSPVMGASLWVFLLLAWESVRTFRTNPYIVIGTHRIPTWSTPLLMVIIVAALVPRTSVAGHLCGVAVGYLFGLGRLRFLHPPEKALRWLESRLNLLGRIPHYISVDQKTYGRFGILPTSNGTGGVPPSLLGAIPLRGSSQGRPEELAEL